MKRYEIKLINSVLRLAASPPSTAVTKGVKGGGEGRRDSRRSRGIGNEQEEETKRKHPSAVGDGIMGGGEVGGGPSKC